MKITLEKGIKNRTMEVVMLLTVIPKGKVFLELLQHNKILLLGIYEVQGSIKLKI